MKLETQEWVEKGEEDLKVAQRESQTVVPVHDLAYREQLSPVQL
jgi:hypothetical protein